MSFSDNPIVYLTKKMWVFSEGNRSQVVLYFILFLCANIVDFFRPLIIAAILNILQEQSLTTETISLAIKYAFLFIASTFAFWVFHGPARVIENKNAFLAFNNYKRYLLEGTMALPAEWHAEHHSGKTIDKIEKATEALFDYSSDSYEFIAALLKFIGSYIVLIYFNIHASYLVLGMTAMTFYVVVNFDRVLVGQYRRLNKADNRISEKVFDVLSNITTVIILRIESLVMNTIVKRLVAPLRLFMHNNKINELKWFVVSLCSSFMIFSVLSTYLLMVYWAGTPIMIGTLYALYGYVDRISSLFFNFAGKYSWVVKRKTRVENVEDISSLFKDKLSADSVRLDDWHELKVEDLNFSYHHGKEALQHLEDISFSIKRNERIAFVGASGSGKTTLMKIIRDMYHPKSAKIYLDGKLLKQGFASISESISLIPQEPELFTSTIKENITLGAPHNAREIKKYIEMARFTEVVSRLPKKLESHIHEKGVNLSGGEKQRLALARGFMASQDKEILLLDEPTSSIDTRNEYVIYQNIFRHFKGKTVISSIHRLHLLPLFDKIYFFSQGRIAASGNFEQLLERSAEFRGVWRKYVKGFKK